MILAARLRWILPATLPALALPAAPAAAAPATWTNVKWSTTYSQPYRNSEAQGFTIGGKLYSFSGFDALKRCANSQPGGGCAPTSRAYRLDPAKGWTALV
ncbi:MAG: hypothetical protein QOG56_1281, partial [Solirubrobacteraceae bacterium]|nr:hypothetical protein [Solirubrobacteraceae bacterium]